MKHSLIGLSLMALGLTATANDDYIIAQVGKGFGGATIMNLDQSNDTTARDFTAGDSFAEFAVGAGFYVAPQIMIEAKVGVKLEEETVTNQLYSATFTFNRYPLDLGVGFEPHPNVKLLAGGTMHLSPLITSEVSNNVGPVVVVPGEDSFSNAFGGFLEGRMQLPMANRKHSNVYLYGRYTHIGYDVPQDAQQSFQTDANGKLDGSNFAVGFGLSY